MFAQFFGEYLLRNEVVTREQFLSAMSRIKTSRLKLGTIAMSRGLMDPAQVDECCFLQTREDKRFGEIAIERGYLTWAQVEDLLSAQEPTYILLGQILVEDGLINHIELEELINNYREESSINTVEESDEAQIRKLIDNLCSMSVASAWDHNLMYLELFFKNVIRFIGNDFTILPPTLTNNLYVELLTTQGMIVTNHMFSHIEMSNATAIEFASRFTGENFEVVDEYVEASLQDFLNIHNGLFFVNMSNMYNLECFLEPPYTTNSTTIKLDSRCIVIPVLFSFGEIHLIITF